MKGNEGVLLIEEPKTGKLIEFPGELFGAKVDAASYASHPDRGYGEVVFNTSMTGYQEILTDPSYYGQIVCMTVPHIGNYGINVEDMESSGPRCSGIVIQELSLATSNWRSTGTLESYLVENKIPGLKNVDTRALTLQLRQYGVARGLILPLAEKDKAKDLLRKLPVFEGRDLIREVTTKKPYHWKSRKKPHAKPEFKVVAIDLGVKWNLLRELENRGCELEVLPATSTAKEILDREPNGVFLSNGPGDPAAATYAVEALRGILGKVPVFGVCMGHQILSLAVGAKTYKLKFGHRGGNQPVLAKAEGKVEISSHNHGYAVDERTLPSDAEVTHINLNDRTVEGISVPGKRAFSVQYHPEACPGPHDSDKLFDRFIDLMRLGNPK